MRGVDPQPGASGHDGRAAGSRELIDGEFVTVMLEGVQPIAVLAIPRAAVLSDQQGDYVYVVERRTRRRSGASSSASRPRPPPSWSAGSSEGEMVISEGMQRVRPGQPVSPGRRPRRRHPAPSGSNVAAAATGDGPGAKGEP